MPNRLIREGFLDSEAIHSLSDAAECFFHRLMLTADDAGRMDGRVEILRARLFPLDISRRASDVEKTLSECVAQGLVIPYERKGQRFLQLTKWQRCSPCVTSKYPWQDGTFRIDYMKVETRDGEKDFVATSIPSARDTDGIATVIPRKAGDGDGDGNVDGGGKAPTRKGKRKEQSLPDWTAALEGDAVPADDPLFGWAQSVGLPREWIALAWWAFEARYEDGAKTYADWRAVFRRAVKEDWLKLWRQGRSGWELTTAGEQVRLEMSS